MKRASSFVLALFLATGMALAQTDKSKTELNPQPLPPGHKVQAESKTSTSGKKAAKKGAKSKKGSSSTSSTTQPK